MNKFFLPLVLFVLSSVLLNPVAVQAKKATTTAPKQTASPTPAAMQEGAAMKKVEYQLPYPGILPDHPLYFLKAIRDRIMDFLIADPVKKAEFYVLQADKRLGMTTMLLDKGNATLAETTLSKGETYMDKAVSTVVNYKAGGKEVPGYLADRMIRSLGKHLEVLSERQTAATDPAKTFLRAELEKVKTLQTQAETLQ